jgi:hypothetical protein
MSEKGELFACASRKRCGITSCPEADPHPENKYCALSFCGSLENGENCLCEPVTEDEK